MIIEKYNLPSNYYSFNPKFDLIYTKVKKEYNYGNNKYYFYFNTLSRIINNSEPLLIEEFCTNISGRPQFINDNSFFYFCNTILKLYEIQNNNYSVNYYYISEYASKSINLDYNYKYARIFDLNNNFFCLNDGNKILLLKKDNLTLTKTISNNVNNLDLLKISNKIHDLFVLHTK